MATETTRRIYELQVKLAQESLAQLKQLKQSAGSVESSFKSLTGAVKGFGTSLVAGLSISAVVSAVNQAISAVDELGAAAQRVGMGVESFSALAFAAEQSDAAMADLEIGLKELQKSMVEVGTKGADVLDALQIDKTKPQLEVLQQFADKFQGIQDPVLKTNALIEVFGKNGLKLRPLLEQGGAGIAELMAKAKELGIVIDEETAKSFSDLDNQMKATKKIAEGLTRDMTAGLAPALMDVMKGFQSAGKEGGTFKILGEALGVVVRGLATALTVSVGQLKLFGTAIGGVAAVVSALFNDGYAAAKSAAQDLTRDLAAQRETTKQTVLQMWGQVEATNASTVATNKNTDATGANDKAVRDALRGKEEAKKLAEQRIKDVLALNKALEDQIFRLENAESAESEYAKAQRAVAAMSERLTKDEREALDLMVERVGLLERIAAAEKKRADSMKQLDDIIKGLRTEEEKLNDDIRELNDLLLVFPERENEIIEAIRRRQLAYDDALAAGKKNATETDKLLNALADKIDGYAKSISSTFVDFATGAADAQKSFSDFATSVLRDLATMTTQMLIMEPLLRSFKQLIGLPGGATNANTPSALGNAFGPRGLLAFAQGGVVASPTTFAFAGGTGLMGEAGPEAIMPLKRNARGQLGVISGGSDGDVTVNVINQAGADVQVEQGRSSNGQREITIMVQRAVADGIRRGSFDSVMSSTYGNSRRGH